MAAKDVTSGHDEDELAPQLTSEQVEARQRLAKLAEEQGVRPMDFDRIRAKAGFWPEDESIEKI